VDGDEHQRRVRRRRRYDGALAMVTDITERRRAEDALRESEERFRSLTMLSSDWYWEHDEEFRLTKVVGGRAYDNNVGLRRAIGQRPWEAASEGMDPADWERHRRQLEAHEPFRDFEITHQGSDGQLYTVSVSGEPVFDERTAASPATAASDATSPSSAAARRCASSSRRSCARRRRWRRSACSPAASRTTSTTCSAGILGNVALAIQDLPPGHPGAWSLEQIRKAGCAGAASCSRSSRSRAASRARWSTASCGRWSRKPSACCAPRCRPASRWRQDARPSRCS
jgi:PAS domain S-box-containing protein